MLWFWIFVILFFAAAAVMLTRNKMENPRAVQEKLIRTAPDDPLSKIGPNEFEEAFRQAEYQRRRTVGGTFVWWFLGAAVLGPLSIPFAALLLGPVFAAVICIAIFGFAMHQGLKRGRAKTRPTLDMMREQFAAEV
ncbi:hypothetical protein [Kordiimonas sp.]|uniref:hypothetical protein n=1 Tax=Kordiimonas sp. TaxID=1970157 RepID=UPI003A8D872D